jgi:hypothetical protein
MSRAILPAALAACLALVGCRHANPSTGNDTEAALDPPGAAAPQRPPAQALAGVAMEDVQPQVMSQADLDSLGGIQDRCVFRLDADGWPSFVYGGARASGVLKLNETLVSLPRTGTNAYADSGLQVTLRPLGKDGSRDGQQPVDLVIHLPRTAQELGFQGYSTCRGPTMQASRAPNGS